jgi:hypothetical protein
LYSEFLHGGSTKFNNTIEVDPSKCTDSGYGKGFWLTKNFTVVRHYALASNSNNVGYVTRFLLSLTPESIPTFEPEESRILTIGQLLEQNLKLIKIWEDAHSPSYSYRVVDLSILVDVVNSELLTKY